MASEEELWETNPISQDDVPLLTKESYMTWKDMMEKFLKNQGLWGYVDGTIHELDQDSSKVKDSPLRKIFKMKCEATVLSYIEGLDIRHIWGQLVTMYEFSHPTNPGEKMKRTHYTWCWPFYKAIVDGDWKTVSEFLSKNKGALSAIITTDGEVPLHVALKQVQNKQRRDNLSKELIKNMSAEDLSKQNKHGRTALHIAASDGNLKIVKAIVEKDKKLVTIQSEPSSMQTIPIMVAASAHKKNVVDYLYPITKSQEAKRKEVYTGERERVRASLLNCLIWNNFYGLAFDLIHENSSLVLIKDMNEGVTISTLSKMPSAFPSSFSNKRSGSGMLGYHFQKFIYSLLDAQVDAKNACWQIKGDAENSFHSNGDSTQENIMCGLCTNTSCFIFRFWKYLRLCFRTLCQNALKLVPGCKNIYYEKLKHNEARQLLHEIWTIIPVLDHDRYQHHPKEVEKVVVDAMYLAIENGIVEFIEEIKNNWSQLLSDYPVFHRAISNRQEKIFGLIHDLGPLKYDLAWIRDRGNLLSHQVAIKAPTERLNQVPGAALQMQRELLWYKEVDSIMFSNHDALQNKDRKTPRQLFTEEHKELVKEGATWMKETATQCMVVATLISTIMFAAVFTVPGSKGSDYIHGKFPTMFVISNILALCSSVASMLLFLAIITSRYAEEDFLSSLPRMLMTGLFFLFISMVAMMIAFVAAIFVMLPSQLFWVSCPIIFIASIPIILYALVELPLFFQLMFTTSSSDVFGKRKK